MLMGTAMMSAMAADTSVPKMNGSAPYSSLTGSQSLLTRKCQPNFWMVGFAPSISSYPISAIRMKMVKAINSVSHLKVRSPKCRSTSFCRPSLTIQIRLLQNKWTKSGRNCALRPAHAHKLSGGGAKSSFNCIEHLQLALLDFIRQWRVVERGRKFLSVGDRPLQKCDKLFAALGVLLLFVNQYP